MSSLKGIPVLLTGGTGFLGRHLMPALQEAEALVLGISRRDGYDLRNEAETLTAMLLARPSIIIHLAQAPTNCRTGTAYRDNFLMGMNVAHAAAIQNASKERVKLVMIGHPACYPTLEGHPEADEETFWNGAPQTSSYVGAMGAAKKAVLQACEAYQVQYGLGYSYLIPDFMYGPYENDSAVAMIVAAIMQAKAMKKKTCNMGHVGAESFLQPLLYVADAVQGILQACAQDPCGGPINLPGRTPSSTLGEIAAAAAKILEYSGKVIWDKPISSEAIRVLKLGRAGREFSWAPPTSLEAGVNEYVNWCWRSIRQPQAATE